MKSITLKILQLVALVTVFLISSINYAQTTLATGDLVITGYNSDNGDQFSFVLLTDVTTSTQIHFTDKGWQSSGSFRTGEGILTWTADQDLSCGTEIVIFRSTDSNPFTATIGTVVSTAGSFILATAGDQITAFQGTTATPTLLYLLNFNSISWTDATNSNNTALPNTAPYILTDGLTAVSLGNNDNGTYNCSVDNDVAALLTAVSDDANWNLNDTTPYTLGACTYFCSSSVVSWCNLQFPPSSTINFGDVYDVFGQVFEPSVTDTPSSQGTGITAWIGFSTVDAVTASDFYSDNWTWIPANYNPFCGSNCGTPENNDEYFIDIGAHIPSSGTYYYVSRFQYNNGPFTYGGYNAGGGGFWDGITNTTQTLTVNPNCASTVTWNGTWTPATGPDISTEVIIATDYDSTTLPSFSACSLTISPGATLTIDDSKYVEVNNDVTINGNLLIRTDGSLVQINDNATVTGTSIVAKNTAVLNNWYEYTYWSSPVSNETIGNGLNESDVNRRFLFNASNYEDATAETNNDNSAVAGQDDIDDNGDDWQYVAPATIMTPGVGYVATHNSFGFVSGNSYQYTFDGILNNGVVSVPVVRNDGEINDVNWNLLGNPYPSAIDVDLFFARNLYNGLSNTDGKLEGAVYLWSQNTTPSNTNNGNESYNFSTSDYAIINGLGEIAGGDAIIPNRYIPSGQSFFIAYTDTTLPSSGNIEFDNSMRVLGNNDQFFRISNSNQVNKISINLTSNNGIFNQALIGYIDGATNGNDGMYYDAPRNLSSGAAAIIYSTIENETRKFAIQGKSPESLTASEIIKLGLINTIDVETTQFDISLANIEGDFMTNTPIYLVDNLLSIEHDLSQSNYTFISEVGEFNDRFEIRFGSTLSIDNPITQEEYLIIENAENTLTLTTNKQSVITNVKMYDMLGRILYDVNGREDFVSLNTSSLKQSIIIVNVTLLDGKVLSKKFIRF